MAIAVPATRAEAPGWRRALFAVHPVMVESVGWVTERKNVLSLPLALGSLLCYLRFAPVDDPDESDATSAMRPTAAWSWYALSMVLFLVALLSKTVVASLPAVLLVIIWWKRGRIAPRDVACLVPFIVMGCVFGLGTAWMEKHHVGAAGVDWDFSPADRVLIAGRAVWFYAAKLLWPYPLAFFYPRSQSTTTSLGSMCFPPWLCCWSRHYGRCAEGSVAGHSRRC